MIEQLCEATKEAVPDFIVKCLEHVSVPAGCVMVGICLYITIKDGLVGDKFTATFTAIGLILLAAILTPALYFYLRNIEDSETSNPFVLDLKANTGLTLRLAEDAQYENVMKELDDHPSERKNSPPY